MVLSRRYLLRSVPARSRNVRCSLYTAITAFLLVATDMRVGWQRKVDAPADSFHVSVVGKCRCFEAL